MPKPAPPRIGSEAWIAAEWHRFRTLSSLHHGLTQPWAAAIALRVSRARMTELMNDGRVPWFQILGKRFIPCDALADFKALDRDEGFRYAAA